MSKLVKSLPKLSGLRKFTNLDREPSAPPVEPVMPDPLETQRFSRLEAARRAKRGARASTILSEPPADSLG